MRAAIAPLKRCLVTARVVLAAYGWSDLEVPPYCPMSDADKKRIEALEDEVIDRLFVLNAKRAQGEKIRGLGSGGGKKTKKRAGKRGGGTGQEGLLGIDEA